MEVAVGEILFLDTNVLPHATDELRTSHVDAQGLITRAGSSGFHLAVSGQVLREYLAVATGPANLNGLGLGVPEAVEGVKRISELTVHLVETEAVALRLQELVRTLGIRGKLIHDANIVATMLAHRVRFLVTENDPDFARFGGLDPLSIRQAALLLQT